MKIFNALLTLAIITVVLNACTSAGPYVTSISNDGNHHLTVEKCMTRMNAFMGTVSNSDCVQSTVSLR